MKIDGGCHCGSITYEATIDPAQVGICHCTDCQTLSGTAFRTGVFAAREEFRLLTGQPKMYVKTTAESGAKRALAFCPECGTSLYSEALTDPHVVVIRLGTARQRGELVPQFQMWCRSALGWVKGLGAIKEFSEQPPVRH